MNYIKITLAIAGAALAAAPAFPKTTVTVSNPADFARTAEIVEIDAAPVIKKEGAVFVVYDPAGNPVASQLTHDGRLIFPVTVSAKGKAKYRIERATEPVVADTVCYGRFFPERDDDMTWENDHCAYRAYGPRLQDKGERGFGYDIWCKSVTHPVIEDRYFKHLRRNMSFHKDHGDGMDVYNVGPTLGGGAAALIGSDMKLIFPWCWKEYEVLDNGPLRFKVRLTYRPVDVEGETMTETRVITLDAGEWLNKTELSYPGLKTGRALAEGMVIHKAHPDSYAFDENLGYVAYEDPTDNTENGNGLIYVGVLSPDAKVFRYLPLDQPAGDAIGHAVALKDYRPGSTETYWWGSGWSKGGVRDMDDWKAKLADKARRIAAPLRVKIK